MSLCAAPPGAAGANRTKLVLINSESSNVDYDNDNNNDTVHYKCEYTTYNVQ